MSLTGRAQLRSVPQFGHLPHSPELNTRLNLAVGTHILRFQRLAAPSPLMDPSNAIVISSPVLDGPQTKTDVTCRQQMNEERDRSSPALLAFLYGSEAQKWTNDHFALDTDVRNLVDQKPFHTAVEQGDLVARITELVEKRASLFRVSEDANRDLAIRYFLQQTWLV